MTFSLLTLTPTLDFHHSLAEQFPHKQELFHGALGEARMSLRKQGITFGGKKEMALGLSALLLNEKDVANLTKITTTLHQIVEKVLGWVTESPTRLEKYFPYHRRIFPWLCLTRGWPQFQVVSRYDAVVTPTGDVKVIELNTSCPAGFLHSETFGLVTQVALESVAVPLPRDAPRYGTIDPHAFVDYLLEREDQSGLEKGSIGILIDENQIMHELDLLVSAFRQRHRQVEVVDARELVYRLGRLTYKKKPLSLVYNKFRVSVPKSRNHCWREGFEQNYQALLTAMKDGAVVAINNLYGITLGEDKSLLGILFEEDVQELLSETEQQFVRERVAWTASLEDKKVHWQGQEIDLLPFIRSHREQFVIKPANEGRGFEVIMGPACTDEEWHRWCQPDSDNPKVVQEFVEAVQFPVIADSQDAPKMEPMFLTLGLGSICGHYLGVLSRISSARITNVAQKGMVQAVYF